MKRQIGRVMVSGDLVRNDPETAAKIFSKMGAVVLRCEHFFVNDVFEYIMYSQMFEEIDKNRIAPQYEIGVISHYEDGEIVDFAVTVNKLPNGWMQATHPTTLELMIEKMHTMKPVDG